jgi:hypothetical protein
MYSYFRMLLNEVDAKNAAVEIVSALLSGQLTLPTFKNGMEQK